MKRLKNGWHKDFGDGEYTEDLCLWHNGKASNICISGWGGCWFLMVGDKTIYTAETIKEAKTFYEEDYKGKK